jgi:patatin-like phospholipase/acyl hydrolase
MKQEIKMSFKNHNDFIADLNAMTMADHLAIFEKYKLTAFENEKETEYFSKYLVQGERKGLNATANVVQARLAVSKLMNDFPHLLGDNIMVTAIKADKATKVAKVKKAAGIVAKVAKVKPQVVAKVKQADGLVWFNKDRNKFIIQVGNDRAARPTAAACLAWVAKKYPDVKAQVAA